jgi:RNA-directed DNA polymerase
MARVARRVDDKRLLRLIRLYLQAGVMEGGLVVASEEGTPQGSPLSPLLSNVMLDDLDWELDRRGLRFVRYADDGCVYVRSGRAGERVMQSITQYVEQRLKLRVNREKSVVDRATRRTLLGFGFFFARGGEVKVRIDPNARKRAKDRLRQLTARTWGVPMERRINAINRFTVGWTAYFALADTPSILQELDEWLRRRMRQVRWKEWKRPSARRRNLIALGIAPHTAHHWAGARAGYWRIAGSAPLQRSLTNAYWTSHGLQGFTDPYQRLRDATRTARCGPARRVVWEGPG